MRQKSPISAVKQLQNGQVWRMPDAALHVHDVGKRLVHYRLFKGSAKRAPTCLSGIDVVEQYLHRHKAVLVER